MDESTLVLDESLSIDQGAVAPWQALMWSLMKDIAREMGVRTDVLFCQLTTEERDIIFHGSAIKKSIIYQNKTSVAAGDMDFNYFNATYTVENALSTVKDEKGMKQVEKFLKQGVCPDCSGTRLSVAVRVPRLRGSSLDEVHKMPLTELVNWVTGVPWLTVGGNVVYGREHMPVFPDSVQTADGFGTGLPSLERAASTLSTEESQRMQLARTVCNRTTGVLYVLDEPSIGLHPLDVRILPGVFQTLIEHGTTVNVIEHDLDVIRNADYIIIWILVAVRQADVWSRWERRRGNCRKLK